MVKTSVGFLLKCLNRFDILYMNILKRLKLNDMYPPYWVSSKEGTYHSCLKYRYLFTKKHTLPECVYSINSFEIWANIKVGFYAYFIKEE